MAKRNTGVFVWSIGGFAALLAIFFGVTSAISGWQFAVTQFRSFWYFIVPLAAGFGVQLGLYQHLRGLVRRGTGMGRVVVATGSSSTAAMISCCAHYLANILPVLGTTGVLSLIGQYQVEFFWFGLAANALGIGYIVRKIRKVQRG